MNDNFENSIRKKLQEADFPFDQDAWNQMENLLNKDKDDDKPPLWWWVILPLCAITIAVVFLLSQPAEERKRRIVALPKVSDSARVSDQPAAALADNQPVPVIAQKTTTASPDNHTKNQIHPGIFSTNNHPENSTSTNNFTQRNSTYNQSKNTTDSNTFTQQSETNNHSKNSINPNTFTQQNSTNNHSKITTDPNTFTQQNPTENIAMGLTEPVSSGTNVHGHTKIDDTVELPVKSGIAALDISPQPKTKKSFNRLYVGLSAGPDYNVAASFKYARLGFNAGVVLHYYFKPKWFVSTGVTYSKKLYGATPQDYSGTTSSYLKKIDANCNVLEVPLNLNYAFVKKKNFSISATAGASSYFMLKEKYNYRYANPSYDKEKVINNENKHYLAVMNLGALYQQPVGNRLILGVQPYAKIPLSGVGAGQVKLYSSGITLQLTLTGRKK